MDRRPLPHEGARSGPGLQEALTGEEPDRVAFKGEPIEAAHVRLWTAGRVKHPDAPLIANELYVAILGAGTPVVDMEISTAGPRIRITARGTDPLPILYSHGPGWQIVNGLGRVAAAAPAGIPVADRGPFSVTRG